MTKENKNSRICECSTEWKTQIISKKNTLCRVRFCAMFYFATQSVIHIMFKTDFSLLSLSFKKNTNDNQQRTKRLPALRGETTETRRGQRERRSRAGDVVPWSCAFLPTHCRRNTRRAWQRQARFHHVQRYAETDTVSSMIESIGWKDVNFCFFLLQIHFHQVPQSTAASDVAGKHSQ